MGLCQHRNQSLEWPSVAFRKPTNSKGDLLENQLVYQGVHEVGRPDFAFV